MWPLGAGTFQSHFPGPGQPILSARGGWRYRSGEHVLLVHPKSRARNSQQQSFSPELRHLRRHLSREGVWAMPQLGLSTGNLLPIPSPVTPTLCPDRGHYVLPTLSGLSAAQALAATFSAGLLQAAAALHRGSNLEWLLSSSRRTSSVLPPPLPTQAPLPGRGARQAGNMPLGCSMRRTEPPHGRPSRASTGTA